MITQVIQPQDIRKNKTKKKPTVVVTRLQSQVGHQAMHRCNKRIPLMHTVRNNYSEQCGNLYLKYWMFKTLE